MAGFTARVADKILRNRRLVRAPITLYKAGLGFVFGSRLLLLEHIGRKSGEPRYVVLEVIGRLDDAYVVASGFGAKAQWYRNVVATPKARIRTGRGGYRDVTARVLDVDDKAKVIDEYNEKHPGAWSNFQEILEETLGEPIEEHAANLPMVALTPQG